MLKGNARCYEEMLVGCCQDDRDSHGRRKRGPDGGQALYWKEAVGRALMIIP